ncbi:MAG: polysaccharide biosynthesis protein, partial [Coraliomargarita sp.]
FSTNGIQEMDLQLMLLASFGQLSSVLSYFRLPDAMRLFGALFGAALVLVSMWYVYSGDQVPPRSVILVDFLFCFLAIGGFRVAMRVKASRGLADWLAADNLENVLIVGAGEVGASLCAELMNKPSMGMRPVGFLDDDTRKLGRYVHGVLVVGTTDELERSSKRYAATKVIIAFPSASVKRVKEVAESARAAGLLVEKVPALMDLATGRAEVSQLRPIRLEDLLGRDPVDLHSDAIRSMLAGKRILVTGAGGSIGSELVKQIIGYSPAVLHCVDQAEIAIFNLQQEVLADCEQAACSVETSILDVSNSEEVHVFVREFQPDVIFHAAAHKHVNLMEGQPAEALKNNFFATVELAKAASACGAERFVLISTDKAINPTSVMGASKRLAELALQEQQMTAGNRTKFMSVRFGNVLGSSGSVIQIFRRQIAEGGPVTVTDPEVTRFFMIVEEAVGLVLESATQGEGGEIFVLDMGKPVKIVDVARQMIELSGLREGVDIDIEFIGLKPGEKLYEEVQHLNEELTPTEHARVLRFVANASQVKSLDDMQVLLKRAIGTNDLQAMKRAIQGLVPEYNPSLG